jgi:predicted hydrocarbon binding protein
VSNVKGAAFSSRLLWVRLNHGDQGLARLRAAVTPPVAELIDAGAVMARWYPFEQFVDLNEQIDRLFGKGDLALVRELGRHGAHANLTTIYRLFYKVGTVRWIAGRATRLWGLHYDSGRMLMVQLPGKEMEMRIEAFDTPHRTHCLSVMGWAERSVELSGGKDVTSEELSCRAIGDTNCRFRVRWT